MLNQDQEKELILRSKNGDTLAFEELISQYQQTLYNIAYRMTCDYHEAWDLAQDTVINAFRSIKGFRGDAKLKTWLYHIMINLYRDKLRKKKRQNELFLDTPIGTEDGEIFHDLPDHNSDTFTIYANQELGEYLRNLILNLQEEYRIILIMREYMFYSYEEIAQELNIPVGTVKSRLNRGRQYLKNKIIAERGTINVG